MKPFIRISVIILLLFIIGLYLSIFDKEQDKKDQSIMMDERDQLQNMPLENKSNEGVKTEGLFQLIGQDTNQLVEMLGEPNRIDLSQYGYQWWIYNDNHKKYVQVGIEKDKVVTFFAIGEKLNIKPFYIGQPIGEIYSSYFIPSLLEFNHQDQEYLFELSEEDINVHPIIQLGEVYVQLYMDKYTGTLSSIRVMDVPTLLKIKPFAYRGEYIGEFQQERSIDQSKLEKALKLQIFDLTNIYRKRFKVDPLKWDEELSENAYNRSVELVETDQNIHDQQMGQGESIEMDEDHQLFLYFLEGENIAVHNLDAPFIVEGWFNSMVHRENMLHKDYKETGIGIYQNYFVQKFSPVDEGKEE